MRSEKWSKYMLSKKKKLDPRMFTPTQFATNSSQSTVSLFPASQLCFQLLTTLPRGQLFPLPHRIQLPPFSHLPEILSASAWTGRETGLRVACVCQWRVDPAGTSDSPARNNPPTRLHQTLTGKRSLSALEKHPQN